MEPTIGVTLICILLFIMTIVVFAWVIWEWGKYNAREHNEYERKYARIQKLINECQVCQKNYDWILLLLQHLGKLKYKNKEKTSVLTIEFFRKYKELAGHE